MDAAVAQAEAVEINSLTQKEALARLAKVAKPEKVLPYLRVPLLHALAEKNDPTLTKWLKGSKDQACATLIKLCHYQGTWLRTQVQRGKLDDDAAESYLSNYFEEECFKPLRASILRPEKNSPFKLAIAAPQAVNGTTAAPFIELLAARERDKEGKWKPVAGLASQWRDGPRTVAQFQERFNRHTKNLFAGSFDWSNIVVAGGCILGLLSGQIGGAVAPAGPSFALMGMDEDGGEGYYGMGAPKVKPYKHSDIDVFIHGLTTAEAFIAKLRALIASFTKTVGKKPLIVRLVNAISLVWDGYPVVQLVLNSYKYPLQVLDMFDLDAVMHAFDGSRVITNTRGSRFLLSTIAGYAANIFTVSNPLSEPQGLRGGRVSKCAKRGIALVVESPTANRAGLTKGQLVQAAKQGREHTSNTTHLAGLPNAFFRLEPHDSMISRTKKGDAEDLIGDDYSSSSNPAVLLVVKRTNPEVLNREVESHNGKLKSSVTAWLRMYEGKKLKNEVVDAAIEAGKGSAAWQKKPEAVLVDGLKPYVASFEVNDILGPPNGSTPAKTPCVVLKIPKSAAKIVGDLQAVVQRMKAIKDKTPLLQPVKVRFAGDESPIFANDTHLFLNHSMPLAASISGFDDELDQINRILARFYAAFIERAVAGYRPVATWAEDYLGPDCDPSSYEASAIRQVVEEQMKPDDTVYKLLDRDLKTIALSYKQPQHLATVTASSVESPFGPNWTNPATAEWLRVFVAGDKRP